MQDVNRLVGHTMRLIRATNQGTGLVTLYKVPGRAQIRSSYAVVAFDSTGREIDRYSFRHMRRLVDAEKVYNWISVTGVIKELNK